MPHPSLTPHTCAQPHNNPHLAIPPEPPGSQPRPGGDVRHDKSADVDATEPGHRRLRRPGRRAHGATALPARRRHRFGVRVSEVGRILSPHDSHGASEEEMGGVGVFCVSDVYVLFTLRSLMMFVYDVPLLEQRSSIG